MSDKKKIDKFSLDDPQVVQDRGRIKFPISAGFGSNSK